MGEETRLTFCVVSKDLHLAQIRVSRRFGALEIRVAIRFVHHVSRRGVPHGIGSVVDLRLARLLARALDCRCRCVRIRLVMVQVFPTVRSCRCSSLIITLSNRHPKLLLRKVVSAPMHGLPRWRLHAGGLAIVALVVMGWSTNTLTL